jgi:hypothetical protein
MMGLRKARPMLGVVATLWVCATSALAADDASFTGNFQSSGGLVCQGGLYVRTKTLDWISTYHVCKNSPYEVLEKDLSGERHRIVFRIKKRAPRCGMEVFELKQANPRNRQWDTHAYPSLEAYRNRTLPGWIDSLAPERQALSCMVFEVGRQVGRPMTLQVSSAPGEKIHESL